MKSRKRLKKVVNDGFDNIEYKIDKLTKNVDDNSIILYHGTTCENAMKIEKEGFIPDKRYNWKVTSSKGFVFLSDAYAPFYAMASKGNLSNLALIKCSVKVWNLYPDDDFVMLFLGKSVYTQEDLNKIDIESYKFLWIDSLKYLGNVASKPNKGIEILGIKCFDGKRLINVCDPSISPINYQIMGDYYRKLTEWIFNGNSPEDFKHEMFKGFDELRKTLKFG